MLGMGASQGGIGGRVRLGLLAAVAALFVLVPISQASAAEVELHLAVEGEGDVYCEVEFTSAEPCAVTYPATLEFPGETEVTLSAEPEEGWEFSEFVGDCDSVGFEECEMFMEEGNDREVTAVFVPEPVEMAVLDLTVEGEGKVECELETGPEKCEPEYPEGTELTLIAVHEPKSEFAEFAGDCEPVGSNECEVVMEEEVSVVAIFELVEGEEEESGGGGSGGGGSGGDSSNPQPVISLPSPIAAGPGKLKVAGAGLYKGGKATLRISCKGDGRCKGTVKLIAKLEVGHKRKKVTVGKASFSLPAGAMKALTIKLSKPAKKLLGKGRTLTANVGGSGVTHSKVKIKPTER